MMETMVRPGERAVLLSHHEYRETRRRGLALESYDLLMRRPEDGEEVTEATPESERWLPVRADKYLKHRANGWREAQSADELPDAWLEAALERDAFPAERRELAGSE